MGRQPKYLACKFGFASVVKKMLEKSSEGLNISNEIFDLIKRRF